MRVLRQILFAMGMLVAYATTPAIFAGAKDALQKLSLVERSLTNRLRTLEGKKKGAADVTVYELRRLAVQAQLRTGLVMQARARLSPGGTQERQADLQSADERFRKVLNSG